VIIALQSREVGDDRRGTRSWALVAAAVHMVVLETRIDVLPIVDFPTWSRLFIYSLPKETQSSSWIWEYVHVSAARKRNISDGNTNWLQGNIGKKHFLAFEQFGAMGWT